MAKYTSPLNVSGSMYDMTLQKNGVVKMKSSLDKEKWEKKPTMKASRENTEEFTGATKCAGRIVTHIEGDMALLAKMPLHSHIAKALRRTAERTTRIAEAFTFEPAIDALHRLDLSPSNVLVPKITIQTIGHALQPTAIQVIGIQEAADGIPVLKGNRLECRIHLNFTRFCAFTRDEFGNWNPDQDGRMNPLYPTGWISPEAIPDEGLRFDLQNPDPNHPQILFMAIEWRQLTPKESRRKIDMKKWSIFRVAALYRSASTMHLPLPASLQGTPKRRYHPNRKHIRRIRREAIPASLALTLATAPAAQYRMPLQGK
jgi:hypothetical protein